MATEVAKVGVFREMTNIRREISEKLNISVHTINRHRQNILRENTR
ncbi:transcriptional regulator, LuxR domain protein [Capnocytophaga sp. oral taxon 335 str. F0486]|nr:transcriptional regulator, LuxR domain protein [Capnocytophaga sp. oral taxon 335 str. F0486]